MRSKRGKFIASFLTVLLLSTAACGRLTASQSDATATPNGSSSTATRGPIVISTDHSLYSPADPWKVTVRNGLATTIYAMDEEASCSILALQTQSGGAWRPAEGAGCPLGRIALVVAVAPGTTVTYTIQAGYPGLYFAYFSPGVYRLSLSYSASACQMPPRVGTLSTVVSQTITVAGPIPPTPTYGPPGTPGSTAVTGTAVASPASTSATRTAVTPTPCTTR
jgi:hypothetical protein